MVHMFLQSVFFLLCSSSAVSTPDVQGQKRRTLDATELQENVVVSGCKSMIGTRVVENRQLCCGI